MGRDEVSESGQEFWNGEEAFSVFWAYPFFGVESGGPLTNHGGLLILFAIIAIFAIRAPLPVRAVLCLPVSGYS
jgi:hypothetical protein